MSHGKPRMPPWPQQLMVSRHHRMTLPVGSMLEPSRLWSGFPELVNFQPRERPPRKVDLALPPNDLSTRTFSSDHQYHSKQKKNNKFQEH
eukprot:569486-Amphidinium_carterae.1